MEGAFPGVATVIGGGTEEELVFAPISAGRLEGAGFFLRKKYHAKRAIRAMATTPPPAAPAMTGVLFGAAELGALGPEAICPPAVSDEIGAVLEGAGLAVP